jgi:hypothetical protein
VTAVPRWQVASARIKAALREPFRPGLSEARLRKGVAWCFRQSGWTLQQIGTYFEVSRERARTMVGEAETRICRRLGVSELPALPPGGP